MLLEEMKVSERIEMKAKRADVSRADKCCSGRRFVGMNTIHEKQTHLKFTLECRCCLV